MKIGIKLAASTGLALMMMAGVATAECRFYEHIDYGGGEWVLQNNDRVHWYDEAQQKQNFSPSGRSNFDGRVFFDNTSGANDLISSVKVVGNCKAVLWEDPFENGQMYETTSDDPNLTNSNFNDIASEADCICQ